MAQLARTGWYREVHIKSEASDRLRLLLRARERMIRIRQDIEAQARGVLKTYGIRLGPVSQRHDRASFRDQFKAATSGDPILETVAASLIAVHDVACAEAAAIEDDRFDPLLLEPVGDGRADDLRQIDPLESFSPAAARHSLSTLEAEAIVRP